MLKRLSKNLVPVCSLAIIVLAMTPCVATGQYLARFALHQESERAQETEDQSKEQSKEKKETQEKANPTPTPQSKGQTKGEPGQTPKPTPQPTTRPGGTTPTPTPAQTGTRPGEKQPQPTPTPSPTPTATPGADKAAETQTPQVSPTPVPTPTEEPTPVKTPEQPASQAPPHPTPSVAIAPVQESQPDQAEPQQTPASLRHELDKLVQSFTFWKIVLSLLVLTLGYLVNRIVVLMAARIGKQKTAHAERLRKMTPFISFGLWFLVVGLVTGIFVQSMLATVALMAMVIIAAGVASQPLLRDLIGGIVILFERPFQIGDRVTLGQHQGEVKLIGLRSFQISTGDESLVAVPNSEVLRQPVINASRGRIEGLVVTELPLPAGCNLAEAKQMAFEAAAVSPYISIHQPIEVSVDVWKTDDANVRLIVRSHVFDVQYERELRSDTIERAQEGFTKLRRSAEDNIAGKK